MWYIASYAQAKPAATITSPAKATTIPKPTSTPAGKPKPVEWADLDLSAANPPLSLIIKVPKGSTVVYDEGLLIASDSSYAVVIDMSYSDMPKPIADRKKEAQENEVFKVQRFIVDKPDMLFYEVKYNGKSEYHFEIAREIKGVKYYLHDKWIADKSFNQKEIEAMLESAKGLRAK